MSAHLKVLRQDQTLVLTISNPEFRNALGPEIYMAGQAAIEEAARDDDVRSVILTGDGDVFCAGGNLQRLQANREKPAQVQLDSLNRLNHWIETLQAFDKPLIAAVEGPCAGAGFSLAMACDFIVSAQDSVFVMSYSNVGLSPDGGATWQLARKLPTALALELMMTGDRIQPQRLYDLGVVNRLSEPGNALSDALALAHRLNLRAPNVMHSIKQLHRAAHGNTLSAQLGAERDHFVANLHHDNGGIGIAAFLAKQKPAFR